MIILALTGLSVLMLIASALLVPFLLVRLPPDYFHREKPHLVQLIRRSSPQKALVLVAKNAIGALLVVAGIAMLLLPGQGLLTMFAGMLLIDFPGKFALERRLVGLPKVLQSINWLRAKSGHAPLEL